MAEAAQKLAGDGAIGIVAAGERWPDGSLRPAIEDMLGAGAIAARLERPASPEAEIALRAYRASRTDLASLIAGSMSGRELAAAGFAGDVEIASLEDVSMSAPVLQHGCYRSFASPA